MLCSVGRIRTCDPRVNSSPHYHCATTEQKTNTLKSTFSGRLPTTLAGLSPPDMAPQEEIRHALPLCSTKFLTILQDDTELDMNQHLRREIPWQAQRAWLVPTSDALPSGRTTKPAPTYQINIQFSKIKRCQLSFAPRGVFPLLSTAGSIA